MKGQREASSQSELIDKISFWVDSYSWMSTVIFVVTWLAVWLLAYMVEYVNHASVWFPAAGLTFAGLLVLGARLIPALVIVAVISTMWAGYFYQLGMSMTELFLPGLVFAFTHITPYYLATKLLR